MKAITAVIFAVVFTTGCIVAQPLKNAFPWTLNTTHPINNRYLPGLSTKTTADKGRIAVRNGKLVYPDGSRARLYGITIAGPAVFPDSAQAIAIAQRLQSLGINLVRLTYFDYTNYNDASILIRSNTTSTGFDSTMLRRFDWFIAQLRLHGIYVSLVLRSVRLARRDDGIPGWDSIRNAGRLYSYFLPSYQMIVRNFIYDLLMRRNQFTGVPYRDDPTIAIVELDQDNSLITQWVTNTPFPLSRNGQLSYLHSRMLDSAFIRFVLAKYRTAQGAQNAWTFTPQSTTNVIGNPSFEDPFDNTWLLNTNGNAIAIDERDPTDKIDGAYSMRIRIAQPGNAMGNIRYRNVVPQLQRYALYRVQIWARTDVPVRYATFAIANFSARDTLRQQWKEYTYTFRSNIEGPADFRIDLGGMGGDVWLDNVRVTALPETALRSGESFANYTVARSRYSQHTDYSIARWRDNLEFYQSLTESWYEWMRRFIHDTLRCEALIAPGNQQSLLNDIYTARLLDLPSVGTGWDSPYRRISGATSDSAWYILNDPQLGNRFGGILYIPARTRIAGKPLMVNSYSVPYPFSGMGELTLLIPAYLAYQDADVFVLTYYAYNRSSLVTPWVRPRYGSDGVGTITHYEYAGNPGVITALPLSSHVFRNQLVAPAREELLLKQTKEALDYPPYNQFGAFFLYSSTDNRLPLFRRIAIDSFTATLQSYQPHREIPALADQANVNTAQLLSDTEELLWNANDTVFLARTPLYRAATGILRGKILDLSGNSTLTIERLDDGIYGTVEFLSRDSTLDAAQTVVMSLVTRSTTTGALWDGDSTVYRNWGGPPMQMEGMRLIVTWRHSADSLVIIPLDSNGSPNGRMMRGIGKGPSGRFRFTIDQAADKTSWYALQFIHAPMSSRPEITRKIELRQTHDQLLFDVVGVEEGTPIFASMFGVDGRCVARWKPTFVRSLYDSHVLEVPSLSSGVYILHLQVGTASLAEKIILAP